MLIVVPYLCLTCETALILPVAPALQTQYMQNKIIINLIWKVTGGVVEARLGPDQQTNNTISERSPLERKGMIVLDG